MSIVSSTVHNQASCAQTAVQLTSTSRQILRGLTVKALAGNSGIVYVGTSSAVTTANGYQLSAGNSCILPVQDQSQVWIISDSGTNSVCWYAG